MNYGYIIVISFVQIYTSDERKNYIFSCKLRAMSYGCTYEIQTMLPLPLPCLAGTARQTSDSKPRLRVTAEAVYESISTIYHHFCVIVVIVYEALVSYQTFFRRMILYYASINFRLLIEPIRLCARVTIKTSSKHNVPEAKQHVIVRLCWP